MKSLIFFIYRNKTDVCVFVILHLLNGLTDFDEEFECTYEVT